MRLTPLVAFAAAIACSCLASSASAALFYNETFSYPDGNLVGNGGWANHSGTGTFIQVSSGTVSTTSGSGSREDANRTTGSTLGQGETWYAGFDLTEIAPAAALTEEYFAHFLQGTSNFTARTYITTPTAGGDYTLGIVGGSNTPPVKWGTDLTFGTKYRVVVSYTLDPDNDPMTQDSFAKLWVNPVNEASTSITKVANFSNAVTAFALRQGSATAAGTQVIDNLAVATTFDEALTGIAIPEPATLSLLALAGVAVFGGARRRS